MITDVDKSQYDKRQKKQKQAFQEKNAILL